MYYEINVAKLVKGHGGKKEYRHFFATAKRSLTSERLLKEAVKIFKEKFPKPEYDLSCTYYTGQGVHVDLKELENGKDNS